MATLTEEQKQKMAEGRRRAAAERANGQSVEPEVPDTDAVSSVSTPEQTFSMSDVQKMIQAAVSDALEKSKTNVVQISTDRAMVKLLYQAEVSDENVIIFGANGKYATITGKSAIFSVPKEAFEGEFKDGLVRTLLEKRNLIVLDGLTDDERELHGVSYKKGEYLDNVAFAKIMKMGDKIVDIYKNLCHTYREMVATRIITEYEKGNCPFDRDTLIKINNISKEAYIGYPDDDIRRNGALFAMLQTMSQTEIGAKSK